MGNNANSIPTGGGPAFRSNIKHKDHEPDRLSWGSAARRTDSSQNAVKPGEEIGGRTERVAETFRHVGGDGSNISRNPSSAHERHAVWAPRPSPQNVVGGREALLYHPTIEIQPLTDELLMAELPKYKKKFSESIQFQPTKTDKEERNRLPGLTKPYSQFQRGNGKTIVKDVCNKISELKEAIVSPQIQKKYLPGLDSPFGDFTQEKKKRSELWPSLANTAHFEQYLPKENREPELIDRVEKDLKQEMIKVRNKQMKEVKQSEETYLVELKKDLMKLSSKNNADEKAQLDALNLDLIKHDLSIDNQEMQEKQSARAVESVKYVWEDETPTLDKAKFPVNISENTSKEAEKTRAPDEIDKDLLKNFKSENITLTKKNQNRIRKIEINSVPEEFVEENSEFSILDETLMDSFEDITLQEFSELDNSLDRIPDFPKDETEAMDGPSVNEDRTESPPLLTGFESRPFDLTKITIDSPSAPPFKPRFFKNATQNAPKKKVGDTKDLTLVEHGYAKNDLIRDNAESSMEAKDEPLDYEHSYVKEERSVEAGRALRFLSVFGPHREGAVNRRKDDRTTNAESSTFEKKEPWSPIAKFHDRREESRTQSRDDNPVGDWVRLENLSKANKKPNFSSSNKTRPF
ncbi:uncharacterized protein LOC106673082 isoform X1 [Cimex lectularius]|uniref:Uncharacterized protein n=2 Tax=Cimex lectularius TaxID=79782 RepID=A0A8I6S7L7_CIMLE|nr:uncharacterized protein LOC106673082 isoform X1 [Cimex lectularius]